MKYFPAAIFSLLIIIVDTGFQSPNYSISGSSAIVAELFTSEGCSSCPAADALLKEMVELTAREDKPIIGLAFHVTYWNHLGWEDPYSQELFTTRQKQYVEKLGASQLYTPQMIVNGEFEFVGSNPIAFRDAIEKAWRKPAPFEIDASAKVANNEVTVSYTLNREPKSERLNVALVEMSLQNSVTRGENKNRILKHYNVVRKFQTIALNKAGEIKIDSPENFNPQNGTIILYIQHSKTFKVLGASKIDLF